MFNLPLKIVTNLCLNQFELFYEIKLIDRFSSSVLTSGIEAECHLWYRVVRKFRSFHSVKKT